jgi:DNA-binding NarL/FixJ family response regulator
MADNDITVVAAMLDDTVAASVLPGLPPFELVATTDTLGDTERAVVAFVPDVLVLDERADRSGVAALCRRVRDLAPATRVLLVAAADDEIAYDALVDGAFSMVPATIGADELRDAVRGAARGESVVLAGAARRLLRDAGGSGTTHDPFVHELRLTQAETAVLERVAAGEAIADIARAHDVIPRLVNLHTGYAVAKAHHHAQRVRARDAVLAAAHPHGGQAPAAGGD